MVETIEHSHTRQFSQVFDPEAHQTPESHEPEAADLERCYSQLAGRRNLTVDHHGRLMKPCMKANLNPWQMDLSMFHTTRSSEVFPDLTCFDSL